jgi:uncharacterized protein YhjY with autotransporter beta-barrel domain/phospholipase/lecithinase/hemolysin
MGSFVMRNPRSPAWARCAFAAAWICGIVCLGPGAAAQEKFNRLFVFGDSYADLTLSEKAASNPAAPPGLALSFWRVYPIPLAASLGIADTQIVDFAVGGATASPFGGPPLPPFLNLPQQVDAFNPAVNTFGARDLVTINIGGNDIRGILGNSPAQNKAFGYPEDVLTPLNAKAFADKTTEYATKEIDRLIAAGAHNFVLGAFSSISGLPELQDQLGKLPPNVAQLVAASADGYAKAYFDGIQVSLAPHAQAGTRFFVFDLARLGQAVNDDPAKYGFTGGFRCPPNGLPAPVDDVCGATPNNPTNNNPLQNQYYFGPDGLHLTNAGFALVARYMANIVIAPDTIAVQPGIVTATMDGFTSSLLHRLGGARQLTSVAGITVSQYGDGQMGLGYSDRHRPPTGSGGRTTTFAMGTFLGGNRSETFDLVGYEYDATAGTAGIEYSISRNLIIGLAGNYTATHADLTSGANIDLDAIQAAAYLSYATKHVFADVLVGLGSHDIGLVRPGVIDAVRSDTDALTFALAARGGYLLDFGSLRAGPIAGLTYIHTRVDGYTEKGDPLLTFDVASQTLETLTGNVGLRFLAPFRAGDSVVIPYLNVMIEHQFGDDTRILAASLTQAPLLPILSPVATFDARTYGKVEGGVTFQLSSDLSASVSGASTFARDDAYDFRVSTGLNFKF